VLGLATRLAAAPVVFTMLIAAFVIHFADPWTMGAGRSKEAALLFASAFFTLIFTGAGKFSFDGMLWPRIKERRARQRAAGK
jgi:putative oxidoreductase